MGSVHGVHGSFRFTAYKNSLQLRNYSKLTLTKSLSVVPHTVGTKSASACMYWLAKDSIAYTLSTPLMVVNRANTTWATCMSDNDKCSSWSNFCLFTVAVLLLLLLLLPALTSTLSFYRLNRTLDVECALSFIIVVVSLNECTWTITRSVICIVSLLLYLGLLFTFALYAKRAYTLKSLLLCCNMARSACAFAGTKHNVA